MNIKYWSNLKCYFLLIVSLSVVACGDQSGKAESKDSGVSKGASSEFMVTSVSDYKFMFNDKDVGGIINFSSKQLSQCTLTFAAKRFVAGYQAKVTEANDKDFDLSCMSESDSFQLEPNDSTYASMDVVSANKVVLNFELIGFNSRETVKKSNVALQLSQEQLANLLAHSK